MLAAMKSNVKRPTSSTSSSSRNTLTQTRWRLATLTTSSVFIITSRKSPIKQSLASQKRLLYDRRSLPLHQARRLLCTPPALTACSTSASFTNSEATQPTLRRRSSSASISGRSASGSTRSQQRTRMKKSASST